MKAAVLALLAAIAGLLFHQVHQTKQIQRAAKADAEFREADRIYEEERRSLAESSQEFRKDPVFYRDLLAAMEQRVERFKASRDKLEQAAEKITK